MKSCAEAQAGAGLALWQCGCGQRLGGDFGDGGISGN